LDAEPPHRNLKTHLAAIELGDWGPRTTAGCPARRPCGAIAATRRCSLSPSVAKASNLGTCHTAACALMAPTCGRDLPSPQPNKKAHLAGGRSTWLGAKDYGGLSCPPPLRGHHRTAAMFAFAILGESVEPQYMPHGCLRAHGTDVRVRLTFPPAKQKGPPCRRQVHVAGGQGLRRAVLPAAPAGPSPRRGDVRFRHPWRKRRTSVHATRLPARS
jgi:hypothetical protein